MLCHVNFRFLDLVHLCWWTSEKCWKNSSYLTNNVFAKKKYKILSWDSSVNSMCKLRVISYNLTLASHITGCNDVTTYQYKDYKLVFFNQVSSLINIVLSVEELVNCLCEIPPSTITVNTTINLSLLIVKIKTLLQPTFGLYQWKLNIILLMFM